MQTNNANKNPQGNFLNLQPKNMFLNTPFFLHNGGKFEKKKIKQKGDLLPENQINLIYKTKWIKRG
jgi:hypothetical protein